MSQESLEIHGRHGNLCRIALNTALANVGISLYLTIVS
jgi:hypothetical protein